MVEPLVAVVDEVGEVVDVGDDVCVGVKEGV